MVEVMIRQGRSLEVTPTWSVATVTTVMVFVCLFAERSIYKFGKWLKKTKRKALFASLEKIKEELMLLGLISLLLGQWARWISQICVNSSLFNSKFYLCSEEDYGETKRMLLTEQSSSSNGTDIPPKGISYVASHTCGEGREPFVSAEGLEQLHRFLFVLGITHVLYSCITVGLAMSKIYSWRKWEIQASVVAEANAQAKHKVMRRQSTFALHHASHPWSRSRVLIWMLCFLKQFRSSVRKSDYMALRLGFITNHKLPLSYNFHKYMVRSMEDEFYGIVGISWPLWGYAILCIFINIHGLNIYFWLSFIPVIWGLKQRSCFMKNHAMITIRLISGVLVQFWCSYSTVPLNVIVTTMGSRCKKALIAESVRESLHSWCKRVKERSKTTMSVTTRSTCSLESTIDERDEIITVASGTLSPSSSTGSLSHLDAHGLSNGDQECAADSSNHEIEHEFSFRHMQQHPSEAPTDDVADNVDVDGLEEGKNETLLELFQKT
ncbi:UNVERIFIED_CONTAM: MLO-like protein 4 [Sesamum latifolium]|uniref:MLO-like protein n=1 Tax=Sesamum latifolium TaxID=2727402 RepID=A0AAW2XK19_9LAMI